MEKTKPNEEEITKMVKELIMKRLQLPATHAGMLTPEAHFINDLGADSLDHVELMMDVERAFRIKIPDADADKISTIEDLIQYIMKYEEE